jgi:hypothetical protein
VKKSKQSFGGNWTEKKLKSVSRYLTAYAKALSKQPGVAVNRILTKSGRTSPTWRARLNALFGDEGWYDTFYQTTTQTGLFGVNLKGIDWVIVGGESGPGARLMPAAWVREILEQCQSAKVAFFFKQWGGVRKSKTGRELDGRTWDEMPIQPLNIYQFTTQRMKRA